MKKLTIVVSTLLVMVLLLIIAGRVYAVSKWFSPYTGYSWASTNKYYFRGKWSSDAVGRFNSNDAWEGELRGRDSPISNYYSGLGPNWWGNFPGGYREYDVDDVTLGMHDPHTMTPRYWYHCWTDVRRKTGAPSSFPAFVESEWGLDFGLQIDPWPQDWETIGYFTIPTGSISW